jgi:hypothetical protein
MACASRTQITNEAIRGLKVKPQRVRDAIDVLAWFGDRAGALPEEHALAVQMQLTMAISGLYLAEYIFHQDQGRDAYDALLGTVRGEAEVPEAAHLWAGLLHASL